ncbi:DNA polymerase III subunit alpha [Acidiferrobacter sp.]|uniref:DNA polymerase III subunit alpha n=2 Tax=Acidiferrobacter sp. TaxID=1872107 RepID=UPI00262ED21C|nr:DNA polymerase III subunit alpha [Acidiferrobacter sp.]
MKGFVHLRVHSEYSLADGLLRLDELVVACHDKGMPAVALTDLANLFGMVKFYNQAVAAGIKPILGADVFLRSDDSQRPYRAALLCQNLNGYRNLSRLLTRAYSEGQGGGHACLDKDWLEGNTDGLIALSGGQDGDVGQLLIGSHNDEAYAAARAWEALFPGRFYVELQRNGRPWQEEYNARAVGLCRRLKIPLVATHDVRFLTPEDFEAHEIRVCIHEGRTLADPRRARRYTDRQYLTSPAEMAALFSDLPEALDNTVEIARRCTVALRFGDYYLPRFPVPEGASVDDVLREDALAGLARRMARFTPEERAIHDGPYRERLDHELSVIVTMGFSGYFLIVADFINWARHNGVPVGPGRGSGAGSLVAYALGITELDPIEHDLLFERFLNPERVSLPDFDVDFCMDGRDRVIEYVTKRYGSDKVSQIITFGTMAAKAVVRDVGRVLDHPYGFVDKLAKLIPHDLGITLDEAIAQEAALRERYEQEEDVRALLDAARKLEGLARNAGKHAGGVVIAPSALTDFMPLYCEAGSNQFVTQLDKDDVEALGLVKFDFLGLRTLTIIAKAMAMINRRRAQDGLGPLAIESLAIDDAAAFGLLKRCQTTALFQLESRGMKDLIQRLQPDRFEEIVALVALFRPGPLQSGMVDDFINRKHGHARIEYPHEALAPILKPTYGVILYQEQVMQIAQVLAGYSLGKADLLRRAMGKKKPEEMAKQREGFVEGARERGCDPRLATAIFNLIEKFAGYGFNRSHSAAYALLSYQTAWLKAHHPAEFMAGVLSADMDKTDKVVTMIAECREMGITVEPPDVNRCDYEFVPIDDHTILYGLGAIKGLGEGAVEAVLTARGTTPFVDLFDLCRRVEDRRVNRRAYECLIAAGACDALGPHRAAMMASLEVALSTAEQRGRDAAVGQDDLFGEMVAFKPDFVAVEPWTMEKRLEAEKDTLGLYLTGHPIDRYAKELKRITKTTIADLRPTENGSVMVGGLVVALRVINTRRGDRMAFVTLDDRTGRIDLVMFGELYQRYRERIVKDALIIVKGGVSTDDYSGGFKMTAEAIYNIDEVRAAFATRLVMDIDYGRCDESFVDGLREILGPVRTGNCPVIVCYHRPEGVVDVVFGEDWRVTPNEAIMRQLEALVPEGRARLIYQDG